MQKKWDFFFSVALPPNAGCVLLIVEVSGLHTLNAPHSVEFHWTNNQPDAETSAWQHTIFTTDKYPCPRDSNAQTQQASGRRPTPQAARSLEPAKKLDSGAIKSGLLSLEMKVQNAQYMPCNLSLWSDLHEEKTINSYHMCQSNTETSCLVFRSCRIQIRRRVSLTQNFCNFPLNLPGKILVNTSNYDAFYHTRFKFIIH